MMPALRNVGRGFSLLLVAASLLLPYIGGFPAAYVMMVLTLLLVGWLVISRLRVEMDLGQWMLFGGFVLLATVLLLNQTPAFSANFLMLLLAVPLTFALRHCAPRNGAQLVGNLALLGVTVAAIVAVWQVEVLGKVRASGFGSDEIWSATAVLIIGWLSLLGMTVSSRKLRWIYVAGPLLSIAVVLLSGSRGAMITAPILLVAAFIAVPRLWRELLVLAAGVIALYGIWPDRGRLTSLVEMGRMAGSVPTNDGSFAIRRLLLDSAIGAFKESPWFGHGWGDFGAATEQFTGTADWGVTPTTFHLHSDLLNFGVAGGVVGLLSYGLFVTAPAVSGILAARDSQQEARRLGGALLFTVYAGCGLTNTFFGFEMHTALFACLYAILFGYCRDRPAGQAT